ncbi:MAG: histidine phosphatase family protein [Firmicutes bacterium]|nr:histidine phosphatase family protein [Bacillota bacterium]
MIYYVRHGETVYNKSGRRNGFEDSTLTGLGVKQALELGQRIRDMQFDVVFSSPLIRARQTCEVILSVRPHDDRPNVITDARLLEFYSGEFEGNEWNKELESDFFGRRELRDYSSVEPIENVEKRIKDFFDEIRDNYKGKKVLVVAHGGIGLIISGYFNGKPKSGFYSDIPFMKNCELVEFN